MDLHVLKAVSFARALSLVLLAAVGSTASPLTAWQGQAPAEAPLFVIVRFANVTGDSADDWIGSGIAESLVSGFPDGRSVLASVATSEGADPNVVALETGRRLGGRFVVTGAYQRIGNTLRITGRVVDVADGSVVRATRVDGSIDELFDLQDRLVADLSGPVASAAPLTIPRPEVLSPAPLTPPLRSEPMVAPALGTPTASEVVIDAIDGPPAPVAPAVINRDAQGRATVRATRITRRIRLDGELDEAVYQTVPVITDFIQQLPDEGALATEKTEAWILFDDTNIYVSARAWDSAPESQWVANELRRDARQIRQNDLFLVLFDTFYDRRNGVAFQTTPLGARSDFAVTNEGNPNLDWNPVWDVRVGRFEGGWTVEMEIPFKSLRYRSGQDPVWGVQLRRGIRRKAEVAYLTALPISAAGAGAGTAGVFRVSQAGTLVGLEPPPASRNIEIKPYAIGGITRDTVADPLGGYTRDGDLGIDVKYGITESLTADLTYNTDFAQVEVDEQQVNLTRFSLFFPEKREFFLEGSGIFDFARGGFRSAGGGGFFGGGNAPTLFYSRRIGLQAGEVVPILGGGRVTGKVGPYSIGALSISTDDQALGAAKSTNFTVARVKRDILRRSAVGGIFTNRSVSFDGAGASRTYGADATLAFYENIEMVGYYARTETPGRSGDDTSYQARFSYTADRVGMQADHLLVEDDFNPEVGFLRRDNFRRTFVEGRFSPRPSTMDSIRQFRLTGSVDYILTADTTLLETRTNRLQFETEFESSDRFGVTVNDNYELLLTPFSPPGADFAIPVGGYAFTDIELAYRLGEQRRFNGNATLQRGGYFNGDITTLGLSQGRIAVLPQMSVEPSLSLNWIDTPQGTFRTDLVVTRVNYAFNPRMFFSGLIQYNSASDTVSNNLRFRWEYSPGSELFVVYTEDRDTLTLRPDRFTELRNRGFVVKFNRLFRF